MLLPLSVRTCKRRLVSSAELTKEIDSINLSLNKNKWTISTSDSTQALEFGCTFKKFATTWTFLNDVAFLAYTLKHHPTITTTYNRVHLSLTTHDAGNTVTYKDIQLALAITERYLDLSPQRKSAVTKGVEDLIKQSRKQISFTEADKMIDDLLALKEKGSKK